MGRPKGTKNKVGHKAGKPKKEIDYRQFEELAKIQCTEKEICAVLSVNTDTLVKRLKEKYDMTFAEIRNIYKDYGRASLRRIQFKLAEKSPAMAIWLGKQYLEQKERIEVSNEDLIEQELEFEGMPKGNVNGKYKRFYNN